MQGGWFDCIAVDLGMPHLKTVGSFGINDAAGHLCLQVSNVTLKTDLPQWIHTIGIKAEDGSLGGAKR